MFKIRAKVYVMEDNKVVEKYVREIRITARMSEEEDVIYGLCETHGGSGQSMERDTVAYEEGYVFKTKAHLLDSL